MSSSSQQTCLDPLTLPYWQSQTCLLPPTVSAAYGSRKLHRQRYSRVVRDLESLDNDIRAWIHVIDQRCDQNATSGNTTNARGQDHLLDEDSSRIAGIKVKSTLGQWLNRAVETPQQTNARQRVAGSDTFPLELNHLVYEAFRRLFSPVSRLASPEIAKSQGVPDEATTATITRTTVDRNLLLWEIVHRESQLDLGADTNLGKHT
jgi:hypothetical protein